MANKLTDKQIIFCKEYIIDFNATRAAIAAGYSEKGARQTASDTLAKTYIQNYISKLMKKRNNKLEISSEQVMQEFAKIAFADSEEGLKGWSKLDLKDKIKALENLGRHTGAYNNDKSNDSVINVNFTATDE